MLNLSYSPVAKYTWLDWVIHPSPNINPKNLANSSSTKSGIKSI